jgi:hypothetical protein
MNPLVYLFVGALFIAGLCVVVKVLEALKGTPTTPAPPADAPPFKKKDWLLTKGEKVFYDALLQAVGSQVHICPKVRLADLVWIPKCNDDRCSWLNKVDRMHIDFVLCRADSLSPLVAI